MTDRQPFQRLSDRLAGRLPDSALHDGVPDWLEIPIRHWISASLDEEYDTARRVCLRLRVTPRTKQNYEARLVRADIPELLDVVDAILHSHPGWDRAQNIYNVHRMAGSFEYWIDRLAELQDVLSDGGSSYRIELDERRLVRRVGDTVEQALDQAVGVAPKDAAAHLRAAWIAAYGRSPDPDKAFNEAIRAVEEIACPLVEEKRADSNKSTLGTVIGQLKSVPHKWNVVLPDKSGGPRNAEGVVTMMEMLWHAQHSRHGGGASSRRQNQEEAEAAVNLAVLLVHWLATGALRAA